MSEAKKRILYVITKGNFGGAQRYVFELAVAMKDHGHTVAVAAGAGEELRERLQNADIETFEIEGWDRDINIEEEWRAFLSLKKLMREWKPDVVHLNSSKAGGLGAVAARLSGVRKIVFTAHGWAFLEDRNLIWKTIVWSLSFLTTLFVDTVITVSRNDRARAPMFFLKDRCALIHTAVPGFDLVPRNEARNIVSTSEERTLHAQDVWLVSIAELTLNKNLSAAIKAVAEFNRSHNQQIFYSIIGGGELRETLMAQILEENIESHIRLLGHVRDARTYLNAFDIAILPSNKEGLPYVILEAGIAHLPVIASNVGGIPEVIEHEKTGLLIDPKHHISITKALKTLVIDTELRSTVADNLHTRVRSEYGLQSMVEKTEALYLQH